MSLELDSNDKDDVILISRDDISNYNPEQILPESSENINRIRSWLQPTNYAHESGEYHKHLASHMPGTGTWLTTSATYQAWLDNLDHGTLWIKGIPGSGKSVVAAHLIESLRRSESGAPVLYFFFRQIIDANHQPAALLRDWLEQVLDFSPPLQKELQALVENKRSMSSLSMDDLWTHLRLALTNLPGKVFCVADALDEMDQGNEEFLQSLAEFGNCMPSKVKLAVTSRPIPTIESIFRKVGVLSLRLDEKMVDTDISTYVERSLQTSQLSDTDQRLIREAIPGHANGIFLFAKLAMNAFLEPGAKAATVLQKIPADLHGMYTNLLREHAARSGVPHDIQLLILQWVTHATRPLRLLELAEIVHTTYQQSDQVGATLAMQTAKSLVRAAVGPLLEILPDETVCVIHHSFTEYLSSMIRSERDVDFPILRFGSTHGRLALACIQYLQAGCLNSIGVNTSDDLKNETNLSNFLNRTERADSHGRKAQLADEELRTRLQFPFYAYAAAHWHLHVVRSCAGKHCQKQINLALENLFADTQHGKAWLKLHWATTEDASGGVVPLHVAARYGLVEYAKHLNPTQCEVDVIDILGRTPLWWAADNGQADMISFLLQAGAEPDVDDRISGLKPLHQAAKKNHAEAIQVLLQAGVDPLTGKTRDDPGRRCGNAPTSAGHTPLMYACQNGHLEALQAFIPFLTDPQTAHRALAWSAELGRSKFVQRLLQHPKVDPNAKIRGHTMLFLACKALDPDSIVALIQAGADPSLLSAAVCDEFAGIRTYHLNKVYDKTRGFTALHALCGEHKRGYLRVEKVEVTVLQDLFALLLEKGAPLNLRDERGNTALHSAVHNPVLTRLLLRAGADANIVNNSGSIPLHNAKLPETIGLLVEEGNSDINKVAFSEKKTPLASMLHKHHNDGIFKLLEYRPDLTVKDSKGNGPLHLALTRFSADVKLIKALLDAGADPNERNRAGETPLLAMCMQNRRAIAIVDLLIEFGADINLKDPQGWTVLSRTVRLRRFTTKSDHAEIQELLARGADLYVRDHKGRSLLHHAVATCDGSRFARLDDEKGSSQLNHLMGLGLDPRTVDHHGNSLIHELAIRWDVLDSHYGSECLVVLEQLLDLGIDINLGNHQGRTALHILSTSPASRHASSTRTSRVGYIGTLEFFISKSRDINQHDNHGLTAVHLASTISEFVTKKLLDAGADPARKTNDGLTPLHLAARARQSNILGLLLDFESVKCLDFLNAKDEQGQTALFHACRSGRPESVELLLDAGADASSGLLWHACAEFEDEEKLWKHDRHPHDLEMHGKAGGLTVGDTTRPGPLHDRPQLQPDDLDTQNDTTRLEEIVEMLITHGCDLGGLSGGGGRRVKTNGGLNKALQSGHEYTFGCLIQARDCKASTQKSSPTIEATFVEHAISVQRDAQMKAVSDFPPSKIDVANGWLVVNILKKRQYHIMRTLFDRGVNFLTDEKSHLEFFARHGYTSLFDQIGVLESERRLMEGSWHAFDDKAKPGLYFEANHALPQPRQSRRKENILLLTALNCELPNMGIVRLLIEKFHVDVNESRYTKEYRTNTEYEFVHYGTSLHELAEGKHWWQVALAIPYLLSKGANVDAKDYAGRTPLHKALGGPDNHVGPFYKDAVRALLAGGADVNEQDHKGVSCLASTAGDLDMVELLLGHKVDVKADALLMSIQSRRVDVLEALLKAGANPNMALESKQQSTSDKAKSQHFQKQSILNGDVSLSEVYPLYYAATLHGAQDRMVLKNTKDIRWSQTVEIMQRLLFSGADPYATFKRQNPLSMNERDKEGDDECVREILREGHTSRVPTEEVVLVHELLEQKYMVHPILALETLEAGKRDAKGRTLLHLACHNYDLSTPIDSLSTLNGDKTRSSMPSFLECLLKHGADPLATDSMGHNVLHHMFLSNKPRGSIDIDESAIQDLTRSYPSLVHQVSVYGKTPLHMAMKHAALHYDLRPVPALIAAGADPSATDGNGNTCLHILAFSFYSSAAVRSWFATLVRLGISINAKNKQGETPIFNLNKHLPSTTKKVLEPKSATEALLWFEQSGADLFARDNSGRGLLHIAAKETEEPTQNDRLARIRRSFGDMQSVEPSIARFQALLSRGLDPMMEDAQKRTALDIAAACGKKSVLGLFKDVSCLG